MKQIQGKQALVRDIGRFGKPRVREIGISLYYPCYVEAGFLISKQMLLKMSNLESYNCAERKDLKHSNF